MFGRLFSLLQHLFVFLMIRKINAFYKRNKMDFNISSNFLMTNKHELTKYQLVYRRKVEGYFEGYSNGYPGHDPQHVEDRVPYGCWFTPLEFNYKYKGSDPMIMIDIGNSLYWRNSTEDLYKYLNLTTEGCLTDGNFCMDKYFCTRVLAMGFNSINFLGITAQVPELIVCDRQCATESFKTACPPIELKQFIAPENINDDNVIDINNTTTIAPYLKRCICNYSSDPFAVNCAGNLNEISYCDNMDSAPLGSKVTHRIEREWNISLGFTRNILTSDVGLVVRSKFKKHLPLLDVHNMYYNSLLINYETDNLNSTMQIMTEKYYLRLDNHRGKRKQPTLLYNNNFNMSRYTTRLFTNRDRYPYSGAVIPMQNMNLGVIILNDAISHDVNLMLSVVRWIIDESLCLRRKDADIIIVMINCEEDVHKYIIAHTKMFINLVVSVVISNSVIVSEKDSVSASTLNGQWHTDSKSNDMHLQLISESNLGVVHLSGNNQSYQIRTQMYDI